MACNVFVLSAEAAEAAECEKCCDEVKTPDTYSEVPSVPESSEKPLVCVSKACESIMAVIMKSVQVP